MARLALVALLAALCGCVSASDRVDYFHMEPRLRYPSFSFDRPPGPLWYLRRSEQSQDRATLRRDIPKGSRTHSFFAYIALGRLAAQPASPEEFAKLADPPKQRAPYQTREVARHVEPATKQGQWCIRYETEDSVLGAPVAPETELVLTLRGFRCLHPAFPDAVLTFYYSERGTRDELDPELSEEGEKFLGGVRFEVPGAPAT
jgi:hypothetical protein